MAETTTPTVRTRRNRKSATATQTTPARSRKRPTVVEVPSERPVEGYVVDLQAEGTETSRKWEKLLAKPANATHVEFQEWFQEATGVELDLQTIQYTLATYHEFQQSPEHKATTQSKRTAAASAKAERDLARVNRAKAALAKAEAATSK